MSYEKIARVVNALSIQTKEQKITWKQTGIETAFSVSFPNYSVIIAKEDYEDDYGRECSGYALRITNENGEIVEEVYSGNLENHLPDSWDIMKEMYEMARRQAMGVEKALDSILDIIDPDVPFLVRKLDSMQVADELANRNIRIRKWHNVLWIHKTNQWHTHFGFCST